MLRARGIHRVGPAGGPARVTASVLASAPDKKIRRGDLLGLYVLSTRRRHRRRTGGTLRGDHNVATPVKGTTPVATKLYGPVWVETRWGGYSRTCVMATGVV